MPDSPQNPSPLPLVPASPKDQGPVPRVPASAKNPPPIPLVPRSRGARGSTGRRAAARRPLPDAQAIRALAVPELAPPYDDTAPAGTRRRPAAREPQAAAVSGTALPDLRGAPGRAPAGTGAWPSQFAQVLAETLAGGRPARQLTPWTTEQARRRISQLGPMLAATRQPRVRRVIVSSPAQGVLEMTVVVDLGHRARAVAVRLERPAPPRTEQPDISACWPRRTAGRNWLCTAIEAA